MSMLPQAIENTDERVDSLLAALVARLPQRLVSRGFKHYSEVPEYDLRKGVLWVVTHGEGDYATGRGMLTKEGTTNIFLIGHLRVEETDSTETLEKAELAFIEEVKTAIRQGHTAMDIGLPSWEKSRLQEHPYGWFVVPATLGPPRANTN